MHFSVFDALQQLTAGNSKHWIMREMINQDIGVQEHRVAGL
jgi:hypothetical protein